MTNSPDNSNADKTSDLANNLEWLAFQYVSNELSDLEMQEFETLLAEQQSAREALVTATQLVDGLNAIESQPAVQPARGTPLQPRSIAARRVLWGLLASVAAILLLVPALFKDSGTSAPSTVTTAQAEPSPEVAEHLLGLWSEAATDSSVAVSVTTGSDTLEFSEQQNVLADNQSLEVPDWLYTAVSLPEESVN